MSEFLKIAFCFEPDSFTGREIVSIVERTKFVVPTLVYAGEYIAWDTRCQAGHLARIAADPQPQQIELATEKSKNHIFGGGPYLSLTNVQRYQCLYLQFPENDPIRLDVLHELAAKRGFRAGYCHDAEDAFWQGESQIARYESRNRTYDHLPRVWDELFKEWAIDISRNPARREGIADMCLQAAWRMWYGEQAFVHIPKEKLLSFRDAQEITVLPGGTVFIQLFDDPLAYDDPENRRRQQSFRDHINFEAVIKKANSEIYGDCHVEDHEGNFEFGGARRSIRWLDDQGRNVLRSRATRMEIREVSSDGRTLLKHWFEPAPRREEIVKDSLYKDHGKGKKE